MASEMPWIRVFAENCEEVKEMAMKTFASAENSAKNSERVLDVKNLTTVFPVNGKEATAVDHISFHLNRGEIIGIVGESGSGKSVAMMSLMKLVSSPGKITAGEVHVTGITGNVLDYPDGAPELLELRGGKIGIVFQEPMTSLNPVLSVGFQISEVLIRHSNCSKSEARDRAVSLMQRVGIPDAEQRYGYYPQQFSGGMRQRIMIAIAIAADPDILIADEATTALDVTTQAQLLEMFSGFAAERGISIIIVTHNMGIIARYASRIYVMYSGLMMESASTLDLFREPHHPYTRSLLRAIPKLSDPKGVRLVPIEGAPPTIESRPAWCPFYDRCVYHTDQCLQGRPPVRESEGRTVTCFRSTEELNDFDAHVQSSAAASLPPKQLGDEIILDVRGVSKKFNVYSGFFHRKVGQIYAVNNVSFSLRRGETLGIVGESGCGKSTLVRCVDRAHQAEEGEIWFDGRNINSLREKELSSIRPRMAMIFQDTFSSLDPRQSVGSIIGTPLIVGKLVSGLDAYNARVDELMRLVGLDPLMKDRKPHEFSGGQRQRIGIARALASNPSLMICDEPISALDVSIQAQIINLLEDLQRKLGISYLFVAHDLAVIKHISDRIMVMYLGKVVESCESQLLYNEPLHPYTLALLSAIPIADPLIDASRERIRLSGSIPSVLKRPAGCPFSDRCQYADDHCRKAVPELREHRPGHLTACFKI